MMKNGAEINRVEDTITRICKACHMPSVEVFATPTGMFVSIDSGDDESEVLTYVSRLRGSTTDLKKISDINRFSREFTTTNMSVNRGLEILEEIESEKPYPLLLRLLSAGLIASTFCLIFSGSLISACFAYPIGIISYLFYLFLGKYDINYFIRGFSSCIIAAALALIILELDFSKNFGSIIIGVIMLFVPGAAITNSIRDFLSGDILSGVSRMVESIIIATSLAAGAGILIKLWSIINAEPVASSHLEANLLFAAFIGFLPTLGFSIIFHVPKQKIFIAAIIGGIAWAAYQLFASYGNHLFTACFLAAAIVGLLSELSARWVKEASTVFIIPGIIPLVPGAHIYRTMLELIRGNYTAAGALGTETLFLAGVIAIALILVGSIVRIVISINRKILSR